MTIESLLMAFLEDMHMAPVGTASHNAHLSQSLLGFYQKKKKKKTAKKEGDSGEMESPEEKETDKTVTDAMAEHNVRQKNLKAGLQADKEKMRARLKQRLAGRGKAVEV